MNLYIKKIEESAVLPTRAHKEDAGADLYSFGEQTVAPGETKKLHTGIAMQIEEGYAFLIRDKSSIGSIGLTTLGGVIDAGYRGEVMVIMHNLTTTSYTFLHGQKIAQALIQKIELAPIIEINDFEKTERGEGGFGSTGK